jgi:signal transduction histidine kinase
LKAALDAAIESNRDAIREVDARVESKLQTTRPVDSDEAHLQIVFNNLLLNSLSALKQVVRDRVISVTTRTFGDRVVISFTDNGCGIAPENLERVFETFFTTNPDSGKGLGLAMVRRILTLYDGTIEVESELYRGTTFDISLKQA